MALKETLTALVTGEAAIRDCLGLFISPDGMCLCEASVGKGGRVGVGQMAKVPMPPGLGTARMGTLNTELLEKTEALVDALKPALGQGKWSSKNLVISLSPHFGLTRYFIMPEVPRKFHKQSIPLEAKKYIPFPFAELLYDFQVVPMPPGADRKPRMGVLFAIMPIKNSASLKALADKLGRDLVAAELASLSTGRLLNGLLPGPPTDGTGAQAEVHFDPQATYVVLHRHGIPFLSREVYWASGAEIDKRRIDLNGCIDFVKKQLGVQNVRIRVMGAGDLGQWSKTFQEDFGTTVETGDPGRLTGGGPLDWQSLAAMGASLRHLLPSAAVIDLSHSTRKTKEDARVIVDLWLASASLSAVFLLLGLWSQVSIFLASRRLDGISSGLGQIGAFQGRTAADIQSLVNNFQTEVQAMGRILDSRTYMTEVMVWLVESLPEAVWLTDVGYAHKLAAGAAGSAAQEGLRLTLTGFATGSDPTVEIQIVNLFRDSLKKDKRFERMFNSIDLALDRAPAGSELERTKFTLTLARRMRR